MLISSKLFKQLASFATVGVISNIAGYGLYLVLAETMIGPKLAVSILYPVGITISYIGNKRFTFDHNGPAFLAALRYILVYAFGYLLNLLLIVWLVDNLGLPHQFVQALAVILVALLSFFMLRIFVFPRI